MNASCAKHARHYSLHHTFINKADHSVEQTSVSFNSFPSMVPYMGPRKFGAKCNQGRRERKEYNEKME